MSAVTTEAASPPEEPAPAGGSKRIFFVRCLALAAIAITTAMTIDEFSPTAPFCGTDGDCKTVTQSAYGRPLGIPLSVIGLVSFLGYFALSLSARAEIRRALGTISLAAGMAGIGLLCLQRGVLKQMCPMCVTVDSIAVAIGAIEFLWPLARAPLVAAAIGRWSAAAVGSALLPMAWLAFQPPTVAPDYVRARWESGVVNVIEVLDFACIYCRETHPVLLEALSESGTKVNFIRIPLAFDPGEQSLAAARLYLSAERTGRSEQLAHEFMQGEDLASVTLVDAALRAGLTQEQIDAATADTAAEQTVQSSNTSFSTAGHPGLPQIWIGDTLLRGAVSKETLIGVLKAASPTEVAPSKQ